LTTRIKQVFVFPIEIACICLSV